MEEASRLDRQYINALPHQVKKRRECDVSIMKSQAILRERYTQSPSEKAEREEEREENRERREEREREEREGREKRVGERRRGRVRECPWMLKRY